MFLPPPNTNISQVLSHSLQACSNIVSFIPFMFFLHLGCKFILHFLFTCEAPTLRSMEALLPYFLAFLLLSYKYPAFHLIGVLIHTHTQHYYFLFIGESLLSYLKLRNRWSEFFIHL